MFEVMLGGGKKGHVYVPGEGITIENATIDYTAGITVNGELLPIVSPLMSGEISGGNTSTSSGSYSGQFLPYKAFNRLLATDGWLSNTRARPWIKLNTAVPMETIGFSISSSTGGTVGDGVVKFKLFAKIQGVDTLILANEERRANAGRDKLNVADAYIDYFDVISDEFTLYVEETFTTESQRRAGIIQMVFYGKPQNG